MRLYAVLSALAVLPMSPSAVLSHGDGFAGQRCHLNWQAGGYHCNREPPAGRSFQSKPHAGTLRDDRDQVAQQVATRMIVGKARIIDGNTIEISGRQIGLFGINAPETGQFCDAAGRKWACGQNATFGLSAIVERQWVYCLPKSSDHEGRIMAICRLAGADGPDINAAMVRQGWAQADRHPPAPYLAEEKAARGAQSGIWAGQDGVR